MAAGLTTLEARGVEIRRGARLIVQELSFVAARGELLALMGPSGTGKTSVLRAVAGLDPITAGTIEIDGLRLAPGRIPRGRQLRDLQRRVGVVFQFHHLFAHMTALQNVWLAPVHVLKRPRAEAERQARELLELLGIADRASAMPHELSGGEAQRVAIARALAVDPPVLLMDEPTASLDQARRSDLAATLRQLAAQARTVVVATHDAEFARACASRILLLDKMDAR
jgi:ABC-type polar amino acid transport system ATPase subunit